LLYPLEKLTTFESHAVIAPLHASDVRPATYRGVTLVLSCVINVTREALAMHTAQIEECGTHAHASSVRAGTTANQKPFMLSCGGGELAPAALGA
jgi:hypothetical protein